MCELLAVSPSAFYEWVGEQEAEHARRDATLRTRIQELDWIAAFLMDFGPAAQEQRVPPLRPDPGERAREWHRMLDSGEVANRAALARRFGVSRARVTQVLRRS